MKELEQLKSLSLKMQKATSKSVVITEKQVRPNKTGPH